ncbi:MAG: hypothetical protein CME70_01175 [Halobacteriovorax sp.]|nr:hypothetical protein [Halobacteriovorax sp.]|tara:strand:- start:60354 stop:60911 length:558 start_codon:yes stop_codon:yes gene_type:complete
MKKIIASALILLSFNALAIDSMTMNIELLGSDIFRSEGKELLGDFSKISGNVAIKVKQDGQTQSLNMPIPLTQAPNNTRMEVVEKNRVRIIEAEHGIDATVPAKIKKKLGGKIKSIKITSENYLMAMRPVLEKQGLDMLQSLNVSSDELSFSVGLEMSDVECSLNEEKDLQCDSSIKMNIDVETE